MHWDYISNCILKPLNSFSVADTFGLHSDFISVTFLARPFDFILSYLIFVPLKIGQVLPKKSVYGENMTNGQVNSGSSIIIFQIGLSSHSTLFRFEMHSYKKALFQVHLYLGFYA